MIVGYDWVLLDPVYLRNKKNPVEIQRWRQFFSKIGLTDFIALKQVNVEISNENIVSWLYMLFLGFIIPHCKQNRYKYMHEVEPKLLECQ